jgi:hypothetical protein
MSERINITARNRRSSTAWHIAETSIAEMVPR